MFTKFQKTVLLTAICFALYGCSSGGGSKGGNNDYIEPEPPPETTPEPEPEPTPEPKPNVPDPTIPEDVIVYVVDHQFDLTPLSVNERERFLEGKAIRQNVDGIIEEGDRNHGGRVSYVLANNGNKNFKINMLEIGSGVNTTSFFDYHIAAGIGESVRDGARVVNVSYSGDTIGIPFSNCVDCNEGVTETSAFNNYSELVTGNDGLGAVLVRSAGNDGSAIQQPSYTPKRYENQLELKAVSIIAGGSIDNGNNIHPLSNYPGEDEIFQSMFLTAPFLHEYDGGFIGGTSYSSPVIASYAGSLIEKWPHLKSDEVVKILLDTASQHSYLYDQNDCGENNDVNCGSFYMGQGEADIESAFEPTGFLRLPVEDTVEGKYVLPENTMAQTSSLYGDALIKSGKLKNIAVFDEMGRDYQMDLSQNISEYSSYKDRMLKQINNALTGSQQNVNRNTIIRNNNFLMEMIESPNGGLETKLGFDFGNSYLYASQKENPYSDIYINKTPTKLSMMSSSTHYNSDIMPNSINRFGMSFDITDNISMYTEYEKTSDNSFIAEDYNNKTEHFSRYNMGTKFSFNNFDFMVDTHYQETGSEAFGLKGSGLFEMDDDSSIISMSMTTQYNINDKLSTYALVERSESNSVGSDYINVSGMEALSYGAGLNWESDEHITSFSVTQPPKVSGGYATFSVPIGRTNDGNVIRETRKVELSPTGRQTDIEFAYRFQKEKEKQFFQFNYLHVNQPGHIKKADSDNAVLVTWGRTF